MSLTTYQPIRKAHAFQVRAWLVTSYAVAMRKHSHRCHWCDRILQTGDSAIIWKKLRGTAACHQACAEGTSNGVPRRALIDAWAYGDEGREHARRQGVEL